MCQICPLCSVVKVRLARIRPRRLQGRKAQVFRAWKGTREEMRALRNPRSAAVGHPATILLYDWSRLAIILSSHWLMLKY